MNGLSTKSRITLALLGMIVALPRLADAESATARITAAANTFLSALDEKGRKA